MSKDRQDNQGKSNHGNLNEEKRSDVGSFSEKPGKNEDTVSYMRPDPKKKE